MAYTPKEWITGEYVTAENLNNIETGIQEAMDMMASEGKVLTYLMYDLEGTNGCFDLTWNEARQQLIEGKIIILAEQVTITGGDPLSISFDYYLITSLIKSNNGQDTYRYHVNAISLLTHNSKEYNVLGDDPDGKIFIIQGSV